MLTWLYVIWKTVFMYDKHYITSFMNTDYYQTESYCIQISWEMLELYLGISFVTVSRDRDYDMIWQTWYDLYNVTQYITRMIWYDMTQVILPASSGQTLLGQQSG